MTRLILALLLVPTMTQCQIENYFPIRVGTTWVYKIFPQISNDRERLTISKDSISSTDSSHFIFLNGAVTPKYRVDALGNVYLSPLGSGGGSNQLIFKQRARKLEAWAASDSSSRIFRIKDTFVEFVINRFVNVKIVEWGTKADPDTFSLSPRSEYYAEGFGPYFVIIEPPSTERILIGFISGKDTIGDITKAPYQRIELTN